MDVLTQFTEKQLEIQYQRILKEIRHRKTIVKKPTAFLLGGQAGAGKTTLHTLIENEMNNNVITIDNDRYKKFHPNYSELEKKYGTKVTEIVKPFSDKITEKLINQLSTEGYNLTIEGTVRTTETPTKTAELLKAKGYITNLYVMAVPKTVSYLSTLERYEDMYKSDPGTARITPKKIHDTIVNGLPGNLDTLFKKNIFNDIRLYTRESQCIYSSQKTPKISPKKCIEDKLQEKLTDKQLKPNLERLVNKMTENNHTESEGFRKLNELNNKLSSPAIDLSKFPKL